MFHSRSMVIYFALFLSGVLVLVYQAMGFNYVGDSVNFLCLMFLIYGLTTRQWRHILENSILMTLGYILPLLIRNSIKLSYQEAPSMKHFLQLAAVSSSTTLLLGFSCTALSFLIYRACRQVKALSRSQVTFRNIDKD